MNSRNMKFKFKVLKIKKLTSKTRFIDKVLFFKVSSFCFPRLMSECVTQQ